MRHAIAAGMLVVCATVWAGPAAAAPDPERLRQAKALYFDRHYAEARDAWHEVLRASSGTQADEAAYWVARCSDNLGQRQRAFGEYEAFLARRPADSPLVAEARSNRLALAARLYREGRTEYLGALTQALGAEQSAVRYLAAIQLAGLGPAVGRPAVPILETIVARETDPDLVDRARLALLRLQPGTAAGARESGRRQGWLRVRVYEKGQSEPHVSVNMPLALAELVLKSLPDDTRADLAREGYDVDNFWDRLEALGPTEVVDVQGEDGDRIRIWIE